MYSGEHKEGELLYMDNYVIIRISQMDTYTVTSFFLAHGWCSTHARPLHMPMGGTPLHLLDKSADASRLQYPVNRVSFDLPR